MKEKLWRLKGTILKKDIELEEWMIKSVGTIVKILNIEDQLKLLIGKQHRHDFELLFAKSMRGNVHQPSFSKELATHGVHNCWRVEMQVMSNCSHYCLIHIGVR